MESAYSNVPVFHLIYCYMFKDIKKRKASLLVSKTKSAQGAVSECGNISQ